MRKRLLPTLAMAVAVVALALPTSSGAKRFPARTGPYPAAERALVREAGAEGRASLGPFNHAGALPVAAAVQQYEGYHDGVDCDKIFGWVWDPSQPNAALDVVIWDGSNFLGMATANQFRQDLLSAGKGNGNHAFNFPTPASLKDGQSHSIRITLSGDPRSELTNTPKVFNSICNSGMPNLAPYDHFNWSGPVVLSKRPGTSGDDFPLTTADSLYLDWSVINNGSAATSASFQTRLYLDGALKQTWSQTSPLGVGSNIAVQDYQLGSLSAGQHTLKIVTDATGVISESRENDNEYVKGTTINSTQMCFTVTTTVSPAGAGSVSANTSPNCSGPSALAESDGSGRSAADGGDAKRGDGRQGRAAATERAFKALREKVREAGTVSVIVGLDAAFEPEGMLPDQAAVAAQRAAIARLQDELLRRLAVVKERPVKRFHFIPFIALEVDADGLALLEASPLVKSIEEDIRLQPALAESIPIIGANSAWASGFSGSGQTVAILDTGVDKNHPFLAGKVVSEACYSSAPSHTSLCPGGAWQSTSPGSGVNCEGSQDCSHGTHVAGIAAGKGTSFSGVAKEANIIAIQVFSRESLSGSLGASASDMALGLQRVYELRSSFNIAAANMSIGSNAFNGARAGNCDSDAPMLKAAIDSLRSAGIATVISAGNGENPTGVSFPGCISSAVSVGSTGDGSSGATRDAVSSFSNSASFLHLLAPGEWITSSVPGGGFALNRGTSMAAPHVTGAWAVLKSKSPGASVERVLTALTSTGQPITDSRNNITKPRIRVDAALGALISSPDGSYNSGSSITMTATPAAGYRFASWSGCDSVSGNTCVITVNSGRNVTANFTTAPASLPAPVTADASAVASAAATLNGRINPGGAATSVWFEWGTNSALSTYTQTAARAVGSGSTDATFAETITGLSSAATYYFRAAASNSAGTSRGSILSFTTATNQGTLRIDSVAPRAGRAGGGQQVKLTGALAGVSGVSLGGVPASSWGYTNGTSEITLTTPAHVPGAVSINLSSAAGTTHSKPNSFAYLPTSFTDDPLVAFVTTAKAQHVVELRQAVDSLRAVAGLPPAPWTDLVLQPSGTAVRAGHILELRSHLEAAAERLGYPAATYTDPQLGAGFWIRRLHVEELRWRIRSIAGLDRL